MTKKLSLKVLACEVFQREICQLTAGCPNALELEFLPVGHHDAPKEGNRDLQQRIDATPADTYDAILVGYGVCSAMLQNLIARRTPLVIPRAHDCIALFLGSKERYEQVFHSHPGTYYFTAGWLDFPQKRALRKGGLSAFREQTEAISSQSTQMWAEGSYAELVEKYGEDNAKYLLEVSEGWASQYGRGVLIAIDGQEPLDVAGRAQRICAARGWAFERMAGDLSLLRRWLAGEWSEADFLQVAPGQQVRPCYDQRIIEAFTPSPASQSLS